MIKNVIFFFLFLILLSCEKKEIILQPIANKYDTVHPLPYFPVYPGSSWSYAEYKKTYSPITYHLERIDTSLTTDTVSNVFLLHAYLIIGDYIDGSFVEKYSDSVFVPYLNGVPIYGYNWIKEVEQQSTPKYYEKYPFLSENVGDTLIPYSHDSRHEFLGPYFVIKDKTLDNQNDSIIIMKVYYNDGFNPNIEWKTYKKDVGLIAHYIFSPIFNDTIYAKTLIDFVINKE